MAANLRFSNALLRRMLPFLLLALIFAACSGDDGRPAATATAFQLQPIPGSPMPTQTVLATATAAAARTPEPTTTASPTRTPAPGVGGLSLQPQLREVDRVVAVPAWPASPFMAWDRESVVLYDTWAMTETNLGKGLRVSFSPDGSMLAMNPLSSGQVRPTTVVVIDLETMASREFDISGGVASFVDENHLYLPGPGERSALNIRNGEVMTASQVNDPLLVAKLEIKAGGGGLLTADGRYRLQRLSSSPEDQCRGGTFEERKRCDAEAFEQWTIEEVATGRAVLELRAYQVRLVGPGELVVATSPVCRDDGGTLVWCEELIAEFRADDIEEGNVRYVNGTSNIYIVDIATGVAEFVATANFVSNTVISPSSWPLSANQNHVIWTDSYCGPERGRTFIFDRQTRELTELDAGFWVELTPDGHLGVDAFGPGAILDIETFE